MQQFAASRTPELRSGPGTITSLPVWLTSRGIRAPLLVVGRSVASDPELWHGLLAMLQDAGQQPSSYIWSSGRPVEDETDARHVLEPDPTVVDAIAAAASGSDAVVGIGGGSAIDTAKAVAAARCLEGSIETYLEGVGSREPSGRRLPLVAVPTTAGTGSEATRNAVLSRQGSDGYKKSLRHEGYVPDLAILDPQLQLSCPRSVTAATGMDAVTQLLEAYVSTEASPFTDALALAGLEHAGRSLLRAIERGETDLDARAGMAFAAYLSGVCLANAGLGTVHGLASPAGAFAPVPHGVFCGLLIAPVTARTIEQLRRTRDGLGALGRYAAAARALTGRSGGSLEEQLDRLMARLTEFARIGGLGRLSAYGVTEQSAVRIARAGGNKNNPYDLTAEQREQAMLSVL